MLCYMRSRFSRLSETFNQSGSCGIPVITVAETPLSPWQQCAPTFRQALGYAHVAPAVNALRILSSDALLDCQLANDDSHTIAIIGKLYAGQASILTGSTALQAHLAKQGITS